MAKTFRYIVTHPNGAAFTALNGRIEGNDLVDVTTRAVLAALRLGTGLVVFDNRLLRPVRPSKIKRQPLSR